MFFFWSFALYQIKSFILAIIRRTVSGIGGAHIRVIAAKQYISFRKNVAAVARRWQRQV